MSSALASKPVLAAVASCFMLIGCSDQSSTSDTQTTSINGQGLLPVAQQQAQYAYALNALQDGSNTPDASLAAALPQLTGPVAAPDQAAQPGQQPLVSAENPTTTEPLEPAPAIATPTSPTIDFESTPVAAIEPAPGAGDSTFSSNTTPGFNATVQADGSVKIVWAAMPGARGYNLYRAAQYVTTVFGTEYVDTDIDNAETYYYRVEAFDNNDNFTRLADGLTVKGAESVSVTNAPENILNDYELVFSEEFKGAELDASKWNTAYLWGSDLFINSEEQYYVDILRRPDFGYNPFVLNGETLTIRSIETPAALKTQALNQPYLSGVITSYDAFKFTYGYVEARVRMPRGRGYWAALWLLNAYYVERKPEIDIVEHIGHEQDRVYHTYHYFDSNDELRSTDSLESAGDDYTADFHTFGVEWKPGVLIYYIDGVEQHRIIDPNVSSQEMYIIANTAVGGWWPGSPDATTPFPGEYEIDYIRAYQKIGPQDEQPQFDNPVELPSSGTRFGSPNHRPSYEDWPEGYPYR